MSKLTVGMPLYNNANTLSRSIESVLNQTFQDFEFYIIDNCSTDDSYEIAKKFEKQDSRIKVYRNKCNLGAFDNFFKLHKMPKSEYFCQKSSDDFLLPSYFEKLLGLLEENKDAVLAYSNADNVTSELFSYDEESPLARGLKFAATFQYGHLGYGIRRSYLDDIIFYPQKLQSNDHAYFFNIALHGKIILFDEKLYNRTITKLTKNSMGILCKQDIFTNPNFMPNIRWMECLLAHMRVIEKDRIIQDKEKYAKQVIEILINRFGVLEYVKEYIALLNSYKKLKTAAISNKNLELMRRKHLIDEYKYYLMSNKEFRKQYNRSKLFWYIKNKEI